MKEIFLTIIGKRGRTTIPLMLRILFGITDETVLKWKWDLASRCIMIFPLFEIGPFLNDKKEKIGMTKDEANQLVENLTDEALQCLLSAATNKLN